MRTPEEIRKILKDNNISGYRLEADLGITQVGADKFLNGTTKKPYKSTLKLYNSYIDNGFKPLKKDNSYTTIEEVSIPKTEIISNKNGNEFIDIGSGFLLMTMPLLEINVQAGFVDNYQDVDFLTGISEKHSIIVKKQHRGRYIAFRVIGDSMDNNSNESIKPNSIVSCRELQRKDWVSRLRINDFPYWVIATTKSNYPLLKQITEHNVELGTIKCHSLNDGPEYQDFELHLNDVNALFYVIDVSRTITNKIY